MFLGFSGVGLPDDQPFSVQEISYAYKSVRWEASPRLARRQCVNTRLPARERGYGGIALNGNIIVRPHSADRAIG